MPSARDQPWIPSAPAFSGTSPTGASASFARRAASIPQGAGDDASRALACARGLVDIGAAVAEEWQRQIDQVEPAAGVHVGMALGEVQMLSLRPFSRTHMGARWRTP